MPRSQGICTVGLQSVSVTPELTPVQPCLFVVCAAHSGFQVAVVCLFVRESGQVWWRPAGQAGSTVLVQQAVLCWVLRVDRLISRGGPQAPGAVGGGTHCQLLQCSWSRHAPPPHDTLTHCLPTCLLLSGSYANFPGPYANLS